MKTQSPTEAASVRAWIAGAKAVRDLYRIYRPQLADEKSKELLDDAEEKARELECN